MSTHPTQSDTSEPGERRHYVAVILGLGEQSDALDAATGALVTGFGDQHLASTHPGTDEQPHPHRWEVRMRQAGAEAASAIVDTLTGGRLVVVALAHQWVNDPLSRVVVPLALASQQVALCAPNGQPVSASACLRELGLTALRDMTDGPGGTTTAPGTEPYHEIGDKAGLDTTDDTHFDVVDNTTPGDDTPVGTVTPIRAAALAPATPPRAGDTPGYTPRPGETRSVSPTGGAKGVKEAQFNLIPVGPLTELAVLYGRGAAKYELEPGESANWRKGYEWGKSYAAALRHLSAFWAGEDYDDEMQVKHVIAAAWHCFGLAWFMENRTSYDDRPTSLRGGDETYTGAHPTPQWLIDLVVSRETAT